MARPDTTPQRPASTKELPMHNPYSAHRNVQTANFVCEAPTAKKVSLVGDFNKWDATANPMKKMPGGAWAIGIKLRHGHHRYAFMTDGHLTLDPRAMGITKDDRDRRVSLMAVS
ncbi:MAG TPA: glycoside hydrolase family 13 [Verrucomicrobiales bacterium]|nr:glycoside hydrolase family 13 [Verrucomicrobiales bacterium]